MTAKKEKVISASAGTTVFYAIVAIVFLSMGIERTISVGGVRGVVFLLFSMAGIAAAVANVKTKIVMLADTIEVYVMMSKKTFLKEDIEDVAWEQKSGANLTVKEIGYVGLPKLSVTPEAVCDSIRVWLDEEVVTDESRN